MAKGPKPRVPISGLDVIKTFGHPVGENVRLGPDPPPLREIGAPEGSAFGAGPLVPLGDIVETSPYVPGTRAGISRAAADRAIRQALLTGRRGGDIGEFAPPPLRPLSLVAPNEPRLPAKFAGVLDPVASEILSDPNLLDAYNKAAAANRTGFGSVVRSDPPPVQWFRDKIASMRSLGAWSEFASEIAGALLGSDSMRTAAKRESTSYGRGLIGPSALARNMADLTNEIWRAAAATDVPAAYSDVWKSVPRPANASPQYDIMTVIGKGGLADKLKAVDRSGISQADLEWYNGMMDAVELLKNVGARYHLQIKRLRSVAAGESDMTDEEIRQFFTVPKPGPFLEPRLGAFEWEAPSAIEEGGGRAGGESTTEVMYPGQAEQRMTGRLRQENVPARPVIVPRSGERPQHVEYVGPGRPAMGGRYLSVPQSHAGQPPPKRITSRPQELAGDTLSAWLAAGDIDTAARWWRQYGFKFGLPSLDPFLTGAEQATEMAGVVLSDYGLLKGVGRNGFSKLAAAAGATPERGAELVNELFPPRTLSTGEKAVPFRGSAEGIITDAMQLPTEDLVSIALYTLDNPESVPEPVRQGGRESLATAVARLTVLAAPEDTRRVRATAQAVYGSDYEQVAQERYGYTGLFAGGLLQGADDVAAEVYDGLYGAKTSTPEDLRLLDRLGDLSHYYVPLDMEVARRPPINLRPGESYGTSAFAARMADDMTSPRKKAIWDEYMRDPVVMRSLRRVREQNPKLTDAQAIAAAVSEGRMAEPMPTTAREQMELARRVISHVYELVTKVHETPEGEIDVASAGADEAMISKLEKHGWRLPSWVRTAVTSAEAKRQAHERATQSIEDLDISEMYPDEGW